MDGGVGQRCPTDKELYEKYSRVLPSGGGACVDNIGKDEVPESMVVAYFGKKSSKSGWKYDCKQTPEEATAIYDLWQRVYDERLMPNREISLQFARGLILQSHDKPVNWVEFAVNREKYRFRAGCTKKASAKKVSGSVDVSLPLCAAKISVLGKRRCTALTPPPLFKLTMKEEVVETESEMDKKGLGHSVANSNGSGLGQFSPIWVASEVTDMVAGIAGCEKLISDFRAELQDRCLEKERLEVEARRARMLLSDRLTLLSEAEIEVHRLCEEEALLENEASGKNCSMVEVEQSLSTALVEKRVEIAMCKRFQERTISLSREVVSECRSTIFNVESCFLESSDQHKVVDNRISSMHAMLDRFRVMLKRMQEGGGNIFFPRPIFSNPESPVSTMHLLNACPLCGYWYSCNNFLSLGCGHTYHPWCLSELVQNSRSCLVQTCLEPFHVESATAIGIRPQAGAQTSTKIPTSTGGIAAKETGGTKHATPEVHSGETSWGTEQTMKGNRIMSQSSQTTAPNSSSAATLIDDQVPETICVLCKTAVAAVILKSCGHNVFCFNCIQGLRSCPSCKKPISGWDSTKSVPRVNPMLLSLGGANDILLDPLLPKKSLKKKVAATPVVQEILTLEEVVTVEDAQDGQHGDDDAIGDRCNKEDFTAVSGADDDEVDGFIHWSDDDAFRNGATRSVGEEEKHCEGNTEAVQVTEEAIEAVYDTEAVQVEATEHRPKVKRRRNTKALDELCKIGPNAKQSISAPLDSNTTLASVTKKKAGRPAGTSKVGASKVGGSKKAVVVPDARSSHLRFGSAKNVVPAKFRNL